MVTRSVSEEPANASAASLTLRVDSVRCKGEFDTRSGEPNIRFQRFANNRFPIG